MKKISRIILLFALICSTFGFGAAAKGAYDSFKVSIYVRAYEVEMMKDMHWLDSTWNIISQQLDVDKIYLETHRDQLIIDKAEMKKIIK